MRTQKPLQLILTFFYGLVMLFTLTGAVWGEYVNNGDGTITDSSTGLIWQQADDAQVRSWQNALSYCESLNFAGHQDWRLPNMRELQSIVDYNRSYPAIDPIFSIPGQST